MKLSLKQKALLQTVGFLFTAVAAAIGVNLIVEHVPFDVIINAVMVGLFGWIMYSVYSLILLRLESAEAAKQRSEK
jgi:hypothetical protein